MNNIDIMNYWIESSDKDYDVVLDLQKIKRNNYALFFGHLSIEKLLKALYAKNNPEEPIAPKIHNLILLSKKSDLDVPNEIRVKIQNINTFNISARYDDYKMEFANKCTDEYTAEQIKNIGEVRIWLKEQLVKKS